MDPKEEKSEILVIGDGCRKLTIEQAMQLLAESGCDTDKEIVRLEGILAREHNIGQGGDEQFVIRQMFEEKILPSLKDFDLDDKNVDPRIPKILSKDNRFRESLKAMHPKSQVVRYDATHRQHRRRRS